MMTAGFSVVKVCFGNLAFSKLKFDHFHEYTMSANAPRRELGREFATKLDREDELRDLREEFIVPTKRELKSKTLSSSCETCF